MSTRVKVPKDYVRLVSNSEVFGTEGAEVVVVTHSVGEDGEVLTTETDISRFVLAAEIPYMKVGDLSRVRLEVICKGIQHSAVVADVLAKSFRPRRRSLRAWLRDLRADTWKLRSWSMGEQK